MAICDTDEDKLSCSGVGELRLLQRQQTPGGLAVCLILRAAFCAVEDCEHEEATEMIARAIGKGVLMNCHECGQGEQRRSQVTKGIDTKFDKDSKIVGVKATNFLAESCLTGPRP